METQSPNSESQQGLTRNKIDLSAIAAEHPVNQQFAVLDLNTFDATQLTLLEVLDMSDVAGVAPENLGVVLSGRSQAKRMKMLYAMAWCIARRANPLLTFEEVATWKLEVIGENSQDRTESIARRAAVIVGAADVTGLHPDEAANLTIAELNAYGDRRKRQNRATRRRAG